MMLETKAEPLRIVLLGYRSNPLSGGQGVYLSCVSKALKDQGHQVTVVSGQPYPILEDGIELVCLPGLDMTNEKHKIRKFRLSFLRDKDTFKEWFYGLTGAFYDPEVFGFRALRWLRANRGSFDAVHDNQTLCTALEDIQKEFPLVCTMHHPLTQDLRLKLKYIRGLKARYGARRWFGSYIKNQKRITPKLDCVVCVSKTGMNEAVKELGLRSESCVIQPCGVDTEKFKPIPQISKDKNRIISVLSADEPIKGGKFLIFALKLLRDEIPGIKLTLVSHLNEDGEVMKAIRTLGLEGNIDFHDGVSPEKLIELYSQASVAVVPSLYEGFGFPAIEAMACGLPVVVTKGGALPEVVDEAALVVPCEDAQALADAVLAVMRDNDLRLRLIVDGRQLINNRYQWPEIAKGIEAVYRAEIAVHNRSSA